MKISELFLKAFKKQRALNNKFSNGQKVMATSCDICMAKIHTAYIVSFMYQKECSWGILQDWYKIKYENGEINILPEKFIGDYKIEKDKLASFYELHKDKIGQPGFSVESSETLKNVVK